MYDPGPFQGWILGLDGLWARVPGMLYEGEADCERRMEAAYGGAENLLDWLVLPATLRPVGARAKA